MKMFMDLEFTGLHKDTTIISLGLVSEDNRLFYAEFTDYDESQVNDWIQENVIDKLNCSIIPQKEHHKLNYYHLGTKSEIKEELIKWLDQFDTVELVSDVCHYDMVLFVDIFGDAFSLPKNIAPVCYDINQDIARYYKISQQEAFDKSREGILIEHNIFSDDEDKHVAMYDAMTIRKIYQIVNNVKF